MTWKYIYIYIDRSSGVSCADTNSPESGVDVDNEVIQWIFSVESNGLCIYVYIVWRSVAMFVILDGNPLEASRRHDVFTFERWNFEIPKSPSGISYTFRFWTLRLPLTLTLSFQERRIVHWGRGFWFHAPNNSKIHIE